MPVTSPYRFVPIGTPMVTPPLSMDNISHNRPIEGQQSGEISVTWTAETPICIGHKTINNAVHPLCLGTGSKKRYAIPGASIKGMIRNVMSIATFSHLGRINSANHFGYRDFNNRRYQEIVKPQWMSAGWLIYSENDGWHLAPAKMIDGPKTSFVYVDTKHLGNKFLNAGDGVESKTKWTKEKINIKYKKIEGRVKFNFAIDESKNTADSKYDQRQYSTLEDSGGTASNYLVCSNHASYNPKANGNRGKEKEALFGPPDFSNKVKLDKATLYRFALLNSTPDQNGLKPDGNWKFWLSQLGYPAPCTSNNSTSYNASGSAKWPGIPVYYITKDGSKNSLEQLNDYPNQSIFIGLSRVIKIPYEYSVADIAARTMKQESGTYQLPDLEKLDFARAIFGDVEDAMGYKGKKQDGDSDRQALKGRVSFGFAFSDNAELENEILEAQMMGPRASFWPFYLVNRTNTSNPASYNDDCAILAGRKRYPAMKKLVTPNAPQGRAGNATISRIQFLEGGTKFNQTIRFHNLHPVELGGLLWCLKFGYTKGNKYRHQVGRGKAFGYGRVRCMFNFDEMSMNEPRVDSLINDFKKHMADALPGLKGDNDKSYWESSPTIDALLKLSHPTDSGDYKYIEEIGSFADIKTRRKGPLLPIKKK